RLPGSDQARRQRDPFVDLLLGQRNGGGAFRLTQPRQGLHVDDDGPGCSRLQLHLEPDAVLARLTLLAGRDARFAHESLALVTEGERAVRELRIGLALLLELV